jgi:hypothetical protein
MDRAEKMDCRANGEFIFCAMGPLLSQWPEITDLINQKTELIATRNGVAIQSFNLTIANCLDRITRKIDNAKQWITN